MNRIKYRVWDKYKECFVTDYVGIRPDGNIVIYNTWYDEDSEGNHYDESWTDIDDENQYIIQQFTETKDKNNKNIYEGDIVKVARTRHWDEERVKGVITCCMEEAGEEIAEVMFLNGRWVVSFEHIRYDDIENFPYHSPNGCHRLEIIGNILENPELLK